MSYSEEFRLAALALADAVNAGTWDDLHSLADKVIEADAREDAR